MTVRKELLERDLKRLGTRRVEAGRGTSSVDPAGQQDGQSSHPLADGENE